MNNTPAAWQAACARFTKSSKACIHRFALDWLNHEARYVGVFQGRFQRINIVVRNDFKPGVKGPNPPVESVSVLKLTMVVVRPWKLPSQVMILAIPAGTPLTS